MDCRCQLAELSFDLGSQIHPIFQRRSLYFHVHGEQSGHTHKYAGTELPNWRCTVWYLSIQSCN